MNAIIKSVSDVGTTRYKLNRRLHRTDGPAVEHINGDKSWYINGRLHRTNGPAVEYADGTKFWWVNGVRHHIDGPAIEWADGHKEWWINGKFITMKNYQSFVNDYPDLVNQFLAHQVLND